MIEAGNIVGIGEVVVGKGDGLARRRQLSSELEENWTQLPRCHRGLQRRYLVFLHNFVFGEALLQHGVRCKAACVRGEKRRTSRFKNCN